MTARLNFQLAFASRIGERLASVKKEAQAAAIALESVGAGTALVLRDKEVELRDFYKSTSEARGTWRGSSASAGYSSAARRAGDRAGRNAKIGADTELSTGSKQIRS